MHRLDEGSSEEDFGFFTLPKHLAIWAELAIIQLIVPNASLLGHLAGILTGKKQSLILFVLTTDQG